MPLPPSSQRYSSTHHFEVGKGNCEPGCQFYQRRRPMSIGGFMNRASTCAIFVSLDSKRIFFRRSNKYCHLCRLDRKGRNLSGELFQEVGKRYRQSLRNCARSAAIHNKSVCHPCRLCNNNTGKRASARKRHRRIMRGHRSQIDTTHVF
jgi:hypothetical protein